MQIQKFGGPHIGPHDFAGFVSYRQGATRDFTNSAQSLRSWRQPVMLVFYFFTLTVSVAIAV
jgi:hypothetical protein